MINRLKCIAGNLIDKIDSKVSQGDRQSKRDIKELSKDEDSLTKDNKAKIMLEKSKSTIEGSKLVVSASGKSLRTQSTMQLDGQGQVLAGGEKPEKRSFFSIRKAQVEKEFKKEDIYKPVTTPSNIWDKKDVDKVLNFEVFIRRFDERFRESLERASKASKFKSLLTGVDFDKCKSVLEKVAWLRQMMTMNEGIEYVPGINYHAQSVIDEFCICSSEEHFVCYFLSQSFSEDLLADESASPKKIENLSVFVSNLVNQLVSKILIVNHNMTTIFKNNCKALFQAVEDYSEYSEDVGVLADSVHSLRFKLGILKESQSHILEDIQKKRKARETRMLAIEGLARIAKVCKPILEFCKEDIVNCSFDDIPHNFEKLICFYIQILELKDAFEAAPIIIEQLLDNLKEKAVSLKNKLKCALYSNLTSFDTVQDAPPSKELIQVFIAYTRVSKAFSDAANSKKSMLDTFPDESALLKKHCLELKSMDGTLRCIESNIVTDFF